MSAYCTVGELDTLGIKAEAYEGKTPTEKQTQIVSTSDEIDSYLANRYTLPIVSWGDVLRKCCAALTCCDLVDSIGRDPDADGLIDVTRRRWMDWLKMVSAGTVTPPDIEDSTPGGSSSASIGASRVVSAASRGYSERGTGRTPGPFQTS